MNVIVAADKNWGIGKNNQLLVSIPADMKMFREETSGKVVVMGRKTLESFPNGLPLKNRINIVITSNKEYEVKGAIIVHSIEEALEEIKKYPAEDVGVATYTVTTDFNADPIGGDSIYAQMLPYCDVAHVTKIDFAYEADSHFPNLDEDDEWEITGESDEQTYFDLEYQFVKYERKK
jgi:dihydrofolate reductase